jgi:hypothetical protein
MSIVGGPFSFRYSWNADLHGSNCFVGRYHKLSAVCQLLVVSFSFRFHGNGQKFAPHNEYYFNALKQQIAQNAKRSCTLVSFSMCSGAFHLLDSFEEKLHQSKGQQLINRLGYNTSVTPGLIVIISPREMVFSIIRLVPPCQERWSSASYCWYYHMESNH